MSNGDSIMNLADMLEHLLAGGIARPPMVAGNKYSTLAKQIIPKWFWVKYHQWKGRNAAIPEEYKKDIVDTGEMQARIDGWQKILADSPK